jgi:hypothetical protein
MIPKARTEISLLRDLYRNREKPGEVLAQASDGP